MEKTQLLEYDRFATELDGKEKIDDKIRICLDYLKSCLSQEKTPAFKEFWQAKRACLDLFKEKITPRARTVFWAEYVEISEEMRSIKEVLDEQSSFALEQMDLAIGALEEDLLKRSLLLADREQMEVPRPLKTELYSPLQNELDLLSNFAGRLKALRKELIPMDLRIKHKNRLFQKLSKLGDLVFPRKKELMEEVSALFISDVTTYVEKPIEGPLFERKEEIKALQNFAKNLSLSPKAFTEMRQKLSEKWDQIREEDKAQYAKRAEKRGVFKENFEKMREKIEALKGEFEKEEPELGQAEEKIDVLFKEMKELELGKEEEKGLRKLLADLKRPFEEKAEKAREERRNAAIREEEKKRLAKEKLLENLTEILDQADVLALDALVEKWDGLVKEGKELSCMGLEKAQIDSKLDAIADHIQEKKWQDLVDKNPEDFSASLHSILGDRHKARRKLKETLELHRKVVGGSGLNFEESMLYQELIGEEKLRLDAIETMIEEIEEKLFDLEE